MIKINLVRNRNKQKRILEIVDECLELAEKQHCSENEAGMIVVEGILSEFDLNEIRSLVKERLSKKPLDVDAYLRQKDKL